MLSEAKHLDLFLWGIVESDQRFFAFLRRQLRDGKACFRVIRGNPQTDMGLTLSEDCGASCGWTCSGTQVRSGDFISIRPRT